MNFDKVIGCKCNGVFVPCLECAYSYNDGDCRGIIEELDGEYVYGGEGGK